jgi:hypothetical protein
VTPDGYPENIDLSDKVLPEEYATIVIDDVMASCAKIRGSYYYVEFEEAREEDKLIDKGVNYQKALDNIASATGYDYISLVSSDTAGSADKDDYRITAATGRFCGFDTSSELGLNDFLSTVSAAGPDAEGLYRNRQGAGNGEGCLRTGVQDAPAAVHGIAVQAFSA